MLGEVFAHYLAHPESLGRGSRARIAEEGLQRTACDHVASMTDRFLIQEYERLFGLKIT
jgi:dGTPase